MKPADLTVGTRIPTTLGVLVVDRPVFADVAPNNPEHDRVWVDVTVENPARFGDPDGLPASTGAEAFQFLTMTNGLRYRLFFLPDTDVKVE